MNRKSLFILMIISYLIVILSFSVCYLLLNEKPNNIMNYTSTSETNCYNEDLSEMSICLGNELKKWYKYNLSNTGKELSINDLKELGGVCSHFAEWYKQELINLGGTYLEDDEKRYVRKEESKFYITKNHIPIKKDLGHVYTVVSNKNYYCSLDQLNIKCTEFKQ